MVKLVIGHRVGNAVTDGAAGHIQSLDAPVQQPDKLKPADTGILTGILKAICRILFLMLVIFAEMVELLQIAVSQVG